MLRQERKTLHLIKKNFGFSEMIFVDHENQYLINDGLKVSYSNDDMPYIIRALADQGYLKIHNHPTNLYFCMTYEGYNRFKLLMDGFKISFITRWIPGFISGAAAAFVAEWLVRSVL